MAYGDIFAGTFRTIWLHKRLWLFGILGRAPSVIGAVVTGILSLHFLQTWLRFMSAMMGSPDVPGVLPQDFGPQFILAVAAFLGLGLAVGIVGYIVNLIMRGAVVHEASLAWSGGTTDTGRGLAVGAARAAHLFAIDLLWWIPLSILIGGAYIGGLVAWIGTVASLAGTSQGDGGQALAVLLAFCGLICCVGLLGLLVAVFVGVFAPLMYQSAVQGQRSVGQAISEGWRLASQHLGPMLMFCLLNFVVTLLAGLLMQAVSYPLSLLYMGGWMSWFAQIAASATGEAPVLPPVPTVNSVLLIGTLLVQSILGLLVYSFSEVFGLTMYAAVYRRLTGTPSDPGAPVGGTGPQPAIGGPSAEPQEAPLSLEVNPEPADAPGVEPASAGPGHHPAVPGPAAAPNPLADLGLSVPDAPPSDEAEGPLA